MKKLLILLALLGCVGCGDESYSAGMVKAKVGLIKRDQPYSIDLEFFTFQYGGECYLAMYNVGMIKVSCGGM